MKFSTQTDNAIELMQKLNCSGKTMTLKELLKGTKISKCYAEKALQKLREARLVGARPGPNGGYYLGRPKVTLWDIVRAVEGPVKSPPKSCRGVARGYAALEAALKQELGSVTLDALTKK